MVASAPLPTPGELAAFFRELRRAGYKWDPRQLSAAERLLLMAHSSSPPPAASRLKTLLAPVLVNSPAQQVDFYARCETWLTKRSDGLGVVERDASLSARTFGSERDVRRERRWRWRLVAGAVVLLLAIGIGTWSWLTVEETPEPSVTETPPAAAPQQQSAPELAPPVPAVPKQDTVSLIQDEPWPLWAAVQAVLTALPLLALVVWVGVRWTRRRLWLERWTSGTVPELDLLRLPRPSLWLYGAPSFRFTAQNLRRHRRVPATDLDIRSTIEATVAHAGLFTPIGAERPLTPEYLFLIEEMAADDHVARLAEEALDRLEDEGVAIERCYFSRDPRVCFRNDARRTPIVLSELAGRTADHRLVVIGTSDGFFHPLSGRLEKWASAWPGRVMMSPRPLGQWSTNELALLEDGFSLATATPKGFGALADYVSMFEGAPIGELLEGTLAAAPCGSAPAAKWQVKALPVVQTAAAAEMTVDSGSIGVPLKVGMGRKTQKWELAKKSKASGQKWMFSAMFGAGVAVVVIGLVGGLHYQGFQTEQALHEQVLAAEQKAAASVAAVRPEVEGVTPKQIAAKYGDATVFIESSWNLYDKVNSKQIFHKYVGGRGEVFIDDKGKVHALPGMPAYVLTDGGELVRWLVTESEDLVNPAIGMASRGSGFVVTPDGSILTNKHVGAGWLMPWEPDYERGDAIGIAFPPNVAPFERKRLGDKIAYVLHPKAQIFKIAELAQSGRLKQWVPGNPSILFSVDGSAPLQQGAFEAKQDLTVTFPGTKLGVSARFLRASQENDVSLIKIDVPVNTPLRTVEMAPSGFRPPLGEPVTVLGYPALSGERYAVTKSKELMGSGVQVPTVTEGIIAKVFETEAQAAESTKIIWYGDYYQLTVNISGPGNSGGPVFDSHGKVIGIYIYGLSGGRAGFAVPIKFGQELLQLSSLKQ